MQTIDQNTGEIETEHRSLIKLDTARTLLAEAKTIDEIKTVRDMAEAARLYAREHKMGLEAQNDCAEIAIRAARAAGKIIPEMFPQGRPEKNIPHRNVLSDAGISPQQSHRWQKLAALPDEVFEEYIETAKTEGDELTTAGALKLVKDLKREQRNEDKRAVAMAQPAGVYNVIYADPPWEYDNTGVHGAANHHYPTMPLDDICNLLDDQQIKVADNAVLFLWATNPFLQDAFFVVNAWGFEYKTNMVWVKTDLVKPGSGFYVRGRHELLLICTRGSFTPLDPHIAPPIGSVVSAPVQDHSSKPEEFYTIIERLYPDCNYIELFARQQRDEWEGWGYDYSRE